MNIQKLFLPIPHLSDDKNQKWTFQSFVFILSLLCYHKRLFLSSTVQI